METMPTLMEDLNRTVKLHTHTAILRLLNSASQEIDIAVMYWSLLPEDCGWVPTNVSLHTTRGGIIPDCTGFTREQLDNDFLGIRGKEVYDALTSALERNVTVRALQSAGFSSEGSDSHPNPESARLQRRFPKHFLLRTLNMSKWYGDGIQHTKFIVVDGESFYLGSSNFMDFRSLSLVKELGVLVENTKMLASDLCFFFDDAWAMSGLTSATTTLYFDPGALRDRLVPSWSPLLLASRTSSPLPPSTPFTRESPLQVAFNGEAPSSVFVSCSPLALCGGSEGRRRTDDELTLVSTIQTARKEVAIAVMDFVPGSMGLWSTAGPPVYWPSLVDAVVQVVNARAVRARILVSQWAWTDPTMVPYLERLVETGKICEISSNQCEGTLEVKTFVVPGWNSTLGRGRKFPGHSRVNHNKYIVTENTANVCTSNMAWSYFRTTVGASLNVQSITVAKSLMDVFDRDWESRYASPVGAGG